MAALDKLEELSAAVARKQVDLPDIQQNKQNSLERPTAYAARQAFHDGLALRHLPCPLLVDA